MSERLDIKQFILLLGSFGEVTGRSRFWGAASSTHGLVSGTGISPNFPHIRILSAAHQSGLV